MPARAVRDRQTDIQIDTHMMRTITRHAQARARLIIIVNAVLEWVGRIKYGSDDIQTGRIDSNRSIPYPSALTSYECRCSFRV